MPKLPAWLVAFVVTTQLTGFFCFRQPENPEPCEMDPLGCDAPESLPLDASCTLSDPLVVTLGEGESDFTPLSPSHPPPINYGFQGGQHYYLGVDVANPYAASPGLEVNFTIQVAADCPLDAASCPEWTPFASRKAVITDKALLHTTASGSVETTGYVVVLDEDPTYWQGGGVETRVQIRAEVRDRCDRKGSAVVDFIASSESAESWSTDSSTASGSGGSTTTGDGSTTSASSTGG